MDSILWNSKMSKEKGILNEWRKQMTMTHCTVAQIASDDFGTQSLGLLPIFQLTSIDRLEFYTDFHMFSMWSTLIMNIHKSFYHFYFKHLRTRALLLMLFILTSTAERVPTISKQFRPFEDSRLSKVTESKGRNSMRPWKTSHVRSFTQLQGISQGVSCLKKFKYCKIVKPFSWGSVFSAESIQTKGTNISNGVGAEHAKQTLQTLRVGAARLHQSKGLKVLPFFKASMRQTKGIAAKCYQYDNYIQSWSFTRAEISVPAAFRIWILKFEHFRPHSSRFLFLVDFIRFYVVIPCKKRLINGPIRMPSYMLIAATSPHVPLAVGVGVRSLCTSLPDLPLTRLGPLTRDDREMKAARNLEEITCNFHRRF